MTTSYISPLQKLRFTDLAGIPLVGGKLFTYDAGTTNKRATFTDSGGGTPNQNPIVLDARGECNCWLAQGVNYKFTLAPATDSDPPANPIWTVDNISGVGDFTTAENAILALLASQVPATGASLVGYKATATGAVGTTLQAKLQLILEPITDFGAAGTGLSDDTSALQSLITGSAGGVAKLTPGKTYLVSGLSVPANTTIDLTGATVKQAILANNVGTPVFTVQGPNVTFIGGGSGLITGQRSLQPANGYSDSFNSGVNGTGRSFRASIMADAVATPGITDLVVRGVRFTAMYGACVACRDVPNLAVEDCVAKQTNFELGWAGHFAATLSNLSYQRNVCDQIGTGDLTVNADCMYAAQYQRAIVANNRVSNGERCLVKIESCAVLSITDNVGDTNSIANFPAIQFDGLNTGQYAGIKGNHLYNYQAGISLSQGTYNNTEITGNTIATTTGATGDAITITANVAGVNITISDNAGFNIKRHGINISGIGTGIMIHDNNMSGQGLAGQYGLVLNATGNWTDTSIRCNQWRNFEQSAVGAGTVNFSRSAAFTYTNFIFQANNIFAGGAANRAVRTNGVDCFPSGIFSDNFIDGQFELYSAAPVRYRNNTVTGTITLPAGTANDEVFGATQTTVGAAGAAAALPGFPTLYEKKVVNGTTYVSALYLPV